MPEPAGLLHGPDAQAALAAGTGLRLAGGPAVFTLLRQAGTVVTALEGVARWPAAVARLTAPVPDWANLGPGPLVMGILNTTPDSFSDGGDRLDPAAAIEAGHAMLSRGADILDIGGESTRPGSPPVPPEEEQARILPVVAALARTGAAISVDTRNAATMGRALDAGARIVNDVSALSWDPASARVVAEAGCPVILMHMRGTPATMSAHAHYTDVAAEVAAELQSRIAAAIAAGISPDQIAVDPGFGFAKTPEQNLDLLQRLPILAHLGAPIVAGISRKATIGMLTGEREARRRDPGSIAAALSCLNRGARLLRVHDVPGTRQAVAVWTALNNPPADTNTPRHART